MAALSNSTPAPGCMGIPVTTVDELSMSLADLVTAYQAHNELGSSTPANIWTAALEKAWGEKEAAMCGQLSMCKPRSLIDVIAALELVAEDGSADLFGPHHISILHNCSDFLSAQA